MDTDKENRSAPKADLPSQKEWKVSDFEFGKKLGRGRFGNAYLVREKKSGLLLVLKVCNFAFPAGLKDKAKVRPSTS